MTKGQKLIRNLFILLLLILIADHITGASLTPLSAHKRSERTANYGPSTIIKSQKVKDGMFYLCKYDKWYSLNTVRRGFLGLWFAGDSVSGKENDLTKPLDYSYTTTSLENNHMLGRYYGIVNNPNIKSIKFEIILNGELKTFEQKELYDNMFLFVWDEVVKDCKPVSLIGLDKDSNIVFEEAL